VFFMSEVPMYPCGGQNLEGLARDHLLDAHLHHLVLQLHAPSVRGSGFRVQGPGFRVQGLGMIYECPYSYIGYIYMHTYIHINTYLNIYV